MKKLVGLGLSSLVFVFCTAAYGVTVMTTLDTNVPPLNPAYTGNTGLQTGSLNRLSPISNCDGQKANPGLSTIAGSRRYDSYGFTPSSSGCVEVTLDGGAGTIFLVAYNSSGFVPSNPSTNYLADPSLSPNTNPVKLFFNVTAGQRYFVVVSEVSVGGGIGTNYTLTVNPVVPQSIAATLDTIPTPPTPAYETATGTQIGRLNQNGVVSNCSSPKPNPGLSTPNPGPLRNDLYRFIASRTGCVTVSVNSGINAVFTAVYYPGNFSPSDPSTNYLADPGSSNSFVRYSFHMNAGEAFIVAVHELNPGGTNIYTLRVTEAISQTPFDFDGDNKTDIGIFRPAGGASEWWINRSSTGVTSALQFGASTDRIVPADYTGDLRADIAFWRPSTGQWFILRSEDNSFFAFPFGTNGDIPAPADYDADGKADAAVFRPSTATWFISQSSVGSTQIVQFGINGDQPVVGDYDFDGRADVAIFRPGPREWWIQRSTAGLLAMQFGNAGDKPVQGEYTNDRKTDIALWRPSTGEWFIVRSENLSFYGFPFGTNGDIPAPGDYDGDARFDPTVFRPSSATWFIARTTAGTQIVQFGVNGDRPLANAFVP